MAAENGIIIVTGSNGRIGDAVMRRFAGRFDGVVGFDRKAPGPPPPGCTYVPVDIWSCPDATGLPHIRCLIIERYTKRAEMARKR